MNRFSAGWCLESPHHGKLLVALFVGAMLTGCNRDDSSKFGTSTVKISVYDDAQWANSEPDHQQKSGWPQLFGPTANAISSTQSVLTTWPEEGPLQRWRVPIGSGYSSIVAANDRLILHHRQQDEERVSCFSTETGELLWSHDEPTDYIPQFHYTDGPISTPVIDEGLVYTVGVKGLMLCLNLHSGDVVWRRSLIEEFDCELPPFGVGSSPVVDGLQLIFSLGATQRNAGLVALDKKTGETRWTATDHAASYSTPRIANIHGKRYLFCLTDVGLVSLDPADGTKHWAIPFRSKVPDSANAVSPIVYNDLVMVAGYAVGALCVRVLPDGSHQEVWRNRRVLDTQYNNLISLHGHVFGFSTVRRSYRCVEMATGQIQWEWKAPMKRGMALAIKDHFLIFGEDGQLATMRLEDGKPKLVAVTERPILKGPCFCFPALYQGRLYVRNENELVCVELRSKDWQAIAQTEP